MKFFTTLLICSLLISQSLSLGDGCKSADCAVCDDTGDKCLVCRKGKPATGACGTTGVLAGCELYNAGGCIKCSKVTDAAKAVEYDLTNGVYSSCAETKTAATAGTNDFST